MMSADQAFGKREINVSFLIDSELLLLFPPPSERVVAQTVIFIYERSMSINATNGR